MKKKLAIFLTAAAMVLSLAACGNQDNKNNGAANNGTTNNGTTNNGTTNNGTTNNGTNNHGTTNNGTNTANTTSFQQMLDNARVHDRDGVLTDGENSTW